MSAAALLTLREKLGEIADIRSAVSVLHWDQETYMPPKGAEARGRQIATLTALAHRFFTTPEMGELLNDLERSQDRLDPDDAKLVEVTQYDYRRATRLPESFVQEFAVEQSRAYEAWVKARAESDFPSFQPHLSKLVDLLRRKADLLGYEESPYDALLEDYERGMSARRLREIFGGLAQVQSALVERVVTSSDQGDLAWLDQDWDEGTQWEFSLMLLRDIGYDLAAGRQDRSVHPFSTSFDIADVRVTTRVNRRNPFSCLFGSLHEGGHALYEQGFSPGDRRTPLADAPSLGIHESQSRLWENLIGRSLPFWRHYTPRLRQQFPRQLEGVSAERIHRAVNHVSRSLIRVEADECTYNLHVILRFEIEVDLIEGNLKVAEVPEAWNAKVKQYLGLDVPDDAQGCLQDIHWSHGSMGYFPTYALGNLYSAQLLEQILRDLPDLWNQVAEGEFAPLLGWLRERVHRHGRRMTAADLVRHCTGHEPEAGAYLRYLETKFGALGSL